MKVLTFLTVLTAGGLVLGAAATTPVLAGAKKASKPAEPNIFKGIDADLKSFDKAVFGTPKAEKKKAEKKKVANAVKKKGKKG